MSGTSQRCRAVVKWGKYLDLGFGVRRGNFASWLDLFRKQGLALWPELLSQHRSARLRFGRSLVGNSRPLEFARQRMANRLLQLRRSLLRNCH